MERYEQRDDNDGKGETKFASESIQTNQFAAIYCVFHFPERKREDVLLL